MTNRFLYRKQFVIDVLHPGRGNAVRDPNSIFVFKFGTTSEGASPQASALSTIPSRGPISSIPSTASLGAMSLWGALRDIIRPLSSRHILPLYPSLRHAVFSPLPEASSNILQSAVFFNPLYKTSLGAFFSTSTAGTLFNSLTETQFPKRRPGTKPRRKRASLKPPGPYAWVQYVPGESIPRSRPNEGSVKGRNRIKRIKQRKAFILSEKKKRKAQYAEFRKRRDEERIQRKMAAVAREKAWAERLIELQRLEAEKKAIMG